MSHNNNWAVTISERGRSGEVTYQEGTHQLKFYWEFMGNDVLASLHIGTAEEWSVKDPWCRDRRDEIVGKVANEVIRQKAPGAVFRIDAEPGFLDILLKLG